MLFFEDMKGAIRVFARIRWAGSVSHPAGPAEGRCW